MKKLLYSTILSTIGICLMYIFSFYLFNYPDESEIIRTIKYHTNWEELLIVYLIIFITSILISLLIFKKHKFFKKFYISIICLNLIFCIFISIKAVNSYIENKKYLSEVVNEFRQNAKKDIEIDSVKYFSQGLLLPPQSEIDAKIQNEVEKIYQKYGLNHKNLGCTISPILTKAQEEYKKLTEIYLEKRNGKNWKTKMEKEINIIYKNSR